MSHLTARPATKIPRMRRPLATLLLVAACTDTTDAPATTTLEATSSTTTADTSTTAEPTPTTTTPIPTPGTTSDETTTTTTAPDPSSTTAEPASTTDVDPPATCGNGEHDRGEQCDEGPQNSNSGTCTLFCKDAVCGDGLVGPGEQCDAGPDNTDDAYAMCQNDCTLGPHCGDGIVQPEEECDLGDNNGTGQETAIDGVPCTQTCRHDAALVFISDATFTVLELGTPIYNIDKHCQALAKAAGLNNSVHFKAWISVDNGAVKGRFDPEVPDLPYALLNGQRIAKSRTALFQQGPEHGITITEKGNKLLKAWVWTDTNTDGTLHDPELDCKEWQTDNPVFKARVGRSGVDENNAAEFTEWKTMQHWTSYATYTCDHKYHIYCFED